MNKVSTDIKMITQPGSFKHVVLIVADAAGTFFRNTPTPNMDRIFANGAVTHRCKVVFPASSREDFGAILLGIDPVVHNLRHVELNTPWPSDSKFPSFFRVIRENDPDAVLASFLNWPFMNTNIIEDNLGVFKARNRYDLKLTDDICEYLESNDPKMLFVQFNEPDVIGHYDGGWGSENQLKNITEIDGYIGRIYDAYKKKGIADDTLFIVTADHGGIDNTHGGDTDGEKYVTFAVAGKGVNNGEIQDMDLRDTAAIVLYALGCKVPETWTARVPTGIFNGVVAIERPVYRNKNSARYHENQPTPAKGSKDYITNYITDHALKTYLTFDDNITDACNGNITQNGDFIFTEGYFGRGIELDHGYVSINNYAPGNDSFTISMWINLRISPGEPCIVSNKDWLDGENLGYALAISSGKKYFKLNLGDGTDCVNLIYDCPPDFEGDWLHLIAVIDRENNKIGISCDFGPLAVADIPANMQKASLNSFPYLNIGQDAPARLGSNGRGDYFRKLHATVDEFIIFEGALDQADIEALARYYGK